MLAIGLSVVTTVGVELFTSGDLAADVRPTEVQGSPAVLVVPTRFDDDGPRAALRAALLPSAT